MQIRIFCLLTPLQKQKFKVYKIIILPVDLYGWDTWTLAVSKDHEFWVCENMEMFELLNNFGSGGTCRTDRITEFCLENLILGHLRYRDIGRRIILKRT
jgi:hypothetical protein